MPSHTALRPLDPTPRRPDVVMAAPSLQLTVEVDVTFTHLANPVLAVSRLLASEAQAFAHVVGDEDRIVISVALPDAAQATYEQAAAWIHWAVHNAGVRGHIRTIDSAHAESVC